MRHLPLIALTLAGCARLNGEPCSCPTSFGALYQGRCVCMPDGAAPAGDLPGSQRFFVDPDVAEGGDGSAEAPWTEIDWPVVDATLARTSVRVLFSAQEADGSGPQRYKQPLIVRRGDPGSHELLLDGRSFTNVSDTEPFWQLGNGPRAQVPGIRTPYDEGVYSHIIVHGFEVTGSRDKGVYWRAGDGVALLDLDVHDNKGSPAVSLEYSSRSGHASKGFVLAHSHIYNQAGECIYIGGAEGTGALSHAGVRIHGNLVHDCRSPWDTKHDGINIKDGLQDVLVERNVIYDVDWGLEIASQGIYRSNVVLDADREGLMVNDGFGPVSGLRMIDNIIVGAGHDGVNIVANTGPATDLVLWRTTVLDARQAGLKVGGERTVELHVDDLAILGNGVGLQLWGEGAVELSHCVAAGNGTGAVGFPGPVRCEAGEVPDLSRPEGPDGVWLTHDDIGYVTGGAQPF